MSRRRAGSGWADVAVNRADLGEWWARLEAECAARFAPAELRAEAAAEGPLDSPADTSDGPALDADQVLLEAMVCDRRVRLAEARSLVLAGRWADLHSRLDHAPGTSAAPGGERLVRVGGEGTPEVAEFSVAEYAAVRGMTGSLRGCGGGRRVGSAAPAACLVGAGAGR